LTTGVLALLAAVFLRGFREDIGLAAAVAIPYLGLNLIVLGLGLVEIWRRPVVWSAWRLDLAGHGDATELLIVSLLVFPKLALGLSGFETGVSVMPLIDGGDEAPTAVPRAGRIRATRKLLAAAIMSVMLLLSSFVTTSS
jgi:hypothetical protein